MKWSQMYKEPMDENYQKAMSPIHEMSLHGLCDHWTKYCGRNMILGPISDLNVLLKLYHFFKKSDPALTLELCL